MWCSELNIVSCFFFLIFFLIGATRLDDGYSGWTSCVDNWRSQFFLLITVFKVIWGSLVYNRTQIRTHISKRKENKRLLSKMYDSFFLFLIYFLSGPDPFGQISSATLLWFTHTSEISPDKCRLTYWRAAMSWCKNDMVHSFSAFSL